MDNFRKLKNLLVMAASDGTFTSEEIDFICQRGDRWGLSNQQISEALAYARGVDAELQFPQDRASQLDMLRDLLLMMAADGELAETEKTLFARAAAAMQLSDTDINILIDSVRPES